LIAGITPCKYPGVPADPPRLLHRHSAHGYTDDPARAMFGEPEAVPADVQAQITAAARRSEHDAMVAGWLERRAAIEREIDWLYSQRLRRDVSSSLRALHRQLDRIEQRITG
jgi:hypothetical protein